MGQAAYHAVALETLNLVLRLPMLEEAHPTSAAHLIWAAVLLTSGAAVPISEAEALLMAAVHLMAVAGEAEGTVKSTTSDEWNWDGGGPASSVLLRSTLRGLR